MHARDDHDAVNGIEIRQKTWCHAIVAFRFVTEHTIEGYLVCDVALRVAEAIVAVLTVHAACKRHWTVRANTCWLEKYSTFSGDARDVDVQSIKTMRVR